MCLFIGVYNHEEEDGRYTAESFMELPDYDEVSLQVVFGFIYTFLLYCLKGFPDKAPIFLHPRHLAYNSLSFLVCLPIPGH